MFLCRHSHYGDWACMQGLLYYLLKYKYTIKAVAAYAVTLHLPGEPKKKEKATLMRMSGLLFLL